MDERTTEATHYLSPSAVQEQEGHRTIDVNDAKCRQEGGSGAIFTPPRRGGHAPHRSAVQKLAGEELPPPSPRGSSSRSTRTRATLLGKDAVRMNEEVGCRPSSREFVTGSAAASSCSLSVQSEVIKGQSFPHLSTPTASRGHVSILVLNDGNRPSTGEASAS